MHKGFKFKEAVNSEQQNKINISIIFNYLKENSPISRSKISDDLKISAASVSRAIEKLIKEEYVVETGKQKTKLGKKPILLEINSEKGYVIGVDLGKERIKVSLADFKGREFRKHIGSEVSDSRDIVDKIINDIKDSLKEDKNGMSLNKIKAISLAIPAAIDINSGKIITAALYPQWKDINFKKILKNEFKIPVFIENDVNLAAFGEKHFGGAKQYENFIFIEVSKGIGAGIIIDNKLFRGNFGSAGEIGFMIVNKENLDFKVEGKGFFEKFASIEGIKERIKNSIKNYENSLILEMAGRDINNINTELIMNAANQEDVLSKSVISDCVELFSVVLIGLILILNPQAIILGGEISTVPFREELFLKPIINRMSKNLPFNYPEIKFSILGDDATLYGAILIAIESLLLDEFPYMVG
jgi:predicted NBD/HSP70 family sugar kinase/biotin operon repressor